MATARFAWGIDIGNRALKAVKLVRDENRLRVDDFDLIEHDQVLSNAGDNRESLIQASLARFIQRHPIKGGVVALGVSGQSSFARFIKLPPVEPKKIPEIVRFEAIQQIPFPLDDVEWSYQLFHAPDSPDVEVGIFAMRKELVAQQIKYLTDIDLNVQVVQMNPLAVYNAMHYDGRLKDVTMIVDLGAENTDLIIADSETVWLRSIPIGGNSFTDGLVKSFKLNFTKAEELKRNAATSKYARQIFQAMRPVFADLVAEIQRSMGFYASVHRDSRIKKIIVSGSTFRLPSLQKYLQQNLQIEVERIDGFRGGVPADAKTATAFSENLLSMVSAYGLAVQALGEAKINSSLLPQQIRRAKIWQEKAKWFGMTAAMFVAGTSIGYGSLYMLNWQQDQEQTRAEQQKIQSILSRATTLSNEWGEIEQSGAADRQMILNIQSLLDHRNLWVNMVRDIRNALPIPNAKLQEALASGNVEQIKQIPRNERDMLIIDQLSTQYKANMTAVLADPDFQKFARVGSVAMVAVTETSGTAYGANPVAQPWDMGGPGGMPYGGPDGMPYGDSGMPSGPTPPVAADSLRGFIITVRCTTPHKDGYKLVQERFVNSLLELKEGSKPGRNYYVAKAKIVSANPLGKDTQRMEKFRAAFNAAKAAAGETAVAPVPGTVAPGLMQGYGAVPSGQSGNFEQAENPYVDSLTNEDVRQDWEFTVLFAVVIDPPAKAKTNP